MLRSAPLNTVDQIEHHLNVLHHAELYVDGILHAGVGTEPWLNIIKMEADQIDEDKAWQKYYNFRCNAEGII